MKAASLIFPHQLFKKHPQMKVMIHQMDRMGRGRIQEHLAIANQFFER